MLRCIEFAESFSTWTKQLLLISTIRGPVRLGFESDKNFSNQKLNCVYWFADFKHDEHPKKTVKRGMKITQKSSKCSNNEIACLKWYRRNIEMTCLPFVAWLWAALFRCWIAQNKNVVTILSSDQTYQIKIFATLFNNRYNIITLKKNRIFSLILLEFIFAW